MKVIQINAVCGTGSTGVIAKNISFMLNKHNIENYIFYAAGHDDYSQAIKISNDIDVKAHALMSHLTGKQAYFSKTLTKRLLTRLDKIKPDVVHLHNLHHNYINLNLLLDYLADKNIKTVITMHDCWYFTGKCTHYFYAGCNRWMTGCDKCPLLKADNQSWFFDRTKDIWQDKKTRFEKIKRLEIVGVSEWIANEAKKSFLRCGNISFIHNGINTDVFINSGDNLRAEYNLNNKFAVLCMANKWQSDANSGLLKYISDRLDKDTVLMLVGGHEENAENIINIPYTRSQEELAKIYRTADVFVNVTHEDSLPTVNLEAMSCGIPVITYDVCGSTETVTNMTGLVVDENDRNGILNAISIIKKQGKAFYSDNCRAHILKNYELYNQFEQYYKIYAR